MENKSAPGRKLGQEKFQEVLEAIFLAAYLQLTLYACIYFCNNPDSPSVILIASAGPWWQWMKVRKEDPIPSPVFMDMQRRQRGKSPYSSRFKVLDDGQQRKLEWNFNVMFGNQPYHYLGTSDSDNALTSIRNTELVPLINACNRLHLSTTMPDAAHTDSATADGSGVDSDPEEENSGSDGEDRIALLPNPTEEEEGINIQFLGPRRRLYKCI